MNYTKLKSPKSYFKKRWNKIWTVGTRVKLIKDLGKAKKGDIGVIRWVEEYKGRFPYEIYVSLVKGGEVRVGGNTFKKPSDYIVPIASQKKTDYLHEMFR